MTAIPCAWVAGRIGLLGDAAHAMLPYHAQGAVQSLEDAWVPAHLLAESTGDVAPDLTRHQALHKDRTHLIVQQLRNAEDWYHLADTEAIARRNGRFRRNNDKFDGGFSPQQHWLYSHDADAAARGTDHDWRALRPWS